LGAAWLATLFVAYQIGERGRSPTSSLSNQASNQGSLLPGERAGSRGRDFNETRRIGAENRFVIFSQTLGGDELARILPEITDKMDLGQVQATLKRLFEEVDPGPSRRIARFELMGRWAQLDSAAAFDHIAELNDPKMRHDLRLKGIEGWASVAPAAALAYAREAEDELVAKSMAAAWAGFSTARDLESAFEFVPTLASEPSPGGVWTVSNAVEALYHNDDIAVISWIQGLAPGPVREQAVRGLVGQWARHDPESAAEWVEDHVDPEDLNPIRELIQGLAATPN